MPVSMLQTTRSAMSYLSIIHTYQVEDTEFDGVKVRIYQQPTGGATDMPAVVYFHGGGWTFGSAGLSLIYLKHRINWGWELVA